MVPSTTIWEKAVQSSQTFLSEEEQCRFQKSGPEDILQDFQHCQKLRGQSSKIQIFLKKIQPLVAIIERYGKPLDVIVNASPRILSPLWGSLRALLLIARDCEEYFSKLMEKLQQIGDTLPRFHAYEHLFQNHEPLQRALSSVYEELISFISRAKTVFHESSFRLLHRQALWRSFDETFRDYISGLERSSARVEHEANLAHMLETGTKFTELSSLIESKIPSSPNLADIKYWLDARKCDEEKEGIEILPGTCEWIKDRPELSTWITEDEIQLFWVYGAPGCGKSFLYAKVLDHINTTTESSCAYFLFCGADGERVTVSALLRSWTFQLAKMFCEAREYISTVRLDSENTVAYSGEVYNIFMSVLSRLPGGFLTVDAVDECTDKEKLYQLLPKIPKRFKVLITSRPLTELSNQLHQIRDKQHVCLEVEPEMTQCDIERYITLELQKPEFSCESKLFGCIRDRLTRSNGQFLWVRLMLRNIEQVIKYHTNNDEVMRCLDELPNGLLVCYDRILNEVNDPAEPARRLLAHKIFFWITVARRPLRVKEVSALLAVKPSAELSSAFDQSGRMSNDSESTILSACRSLLVARGAERVLYPIHFTATEYLKRYMGTGVRLMEITRYYDALQLQSSDSLAAAVCMRYLSLDFIAAIHDKVRTNYSEAVAVFSSDTSELDVLEYATVHWVKHLQRVEIPESHLLNIAEDFLDVNRPNLDVFWHLYWLSAPESTEPALCPINSPATHVAAYFGLHHTLRHLLRNRNPATLDSTGKSALWWSANRGHVATTKVLIEAGVDPNVPDKYSFTPAHRAAAIGNADLFEQIMSFQPKNRHTVFDKKGWTPLHWACSRGHAAVAQQILHCRDGLEVYGTPYSLTRAGRTPLHFAARNGRTELISVLSVKTSQKQYSLPNIQDSEGYTALHLAASKGHLRVVEELVRCGADPRIRDHAGRTPADRAFEMGKFAVHSALLEVPDAIQVTDNRELHVKGWRPCRQQIVWLSFLVLLFSFSFLYP